jgi:CBS domain-containing protein
LSRGRPRATLGAVHPVEFLRATPPFDRLPRALFDAAAADLETCRHPAGATLAHAGGEPLQHLYVVRAGSVRVERHGHTVEVVEEGELFGFTSLLTGVAALDVVVEEDLLAYRLPKETFRRLLADPAFAGHFAAGLGDRLRSTLDHAPVAPFEPDLSMAIGELVRTPAVWVGPDESVLAAARLMRDRRISSVLVRTDPPRILTDRDLRNRVIAEGLSAEVPVSVVASGPLRTVPAETPIHEAWMELLDAGLHHLPVLRGGDIAGVVTSTDLMRSSAHGPMAVLRRVERIASRDGLPGYGRQVEEMVAWLLASRIDAVVIAQLVARLNDALLRLVLRWAEADLGAAPAPWAWLALGSEGRAEQTLLTDQDNALVHEGEGDEASAWFARFADRVNSDLEAAGFPRCRGGYMARAWHDPLHAWVSRFRGWVADPAPQALLEAAIFFDFRRAAGPLDLGPLHEAAAEAGRDGRFLRAMAEQAVRFQPPPMLLLRMRPGSPVVDLKKHGLSPVVFLARCYALEVGASPRNTLERLEAAERAGLMEPELRVTVSEAYRFLLGLRLRRQLRAASQGGAASDEAALSEFTPVERSRLKEAFRAIRGWQDMAAYHYHL